MDELDHLPPLTGARALEVAAGGGRLARRLMATFAEVVALETPEVLARLAPAAEPGLAWVGGDALALPFPDAHFDVAAIAWSLHHLPDPARALAELARVVRPGGRLVVAEPFEAWVGDARDHHLAAHLLTAARDRAEGICHQPIYRREALEALLAALGCRDVVAVPVMAIPGEADAPLDQRVADAAPWVAALERTADHPGVDEVDRLAARALAASVAAEGLLTSPHLVWCGVRA